VSTGWILPLSLVCVGIGLELTPERARMSAVACVEQIRVVATAVLYETACSVSR
jgi:hypothetical protein